ncbi:MAG: helix-turn-helix domain-containing protein [Nitrososphaeria archaeon]
MKIYVNSALFYPSKDKIIASAIVKVKNRKEIYNFFYNFVKSYPAKRNIKRIIKLSNFGVYFINYETEYEFSILRIIHEMEIPIWSLEVHDGLEFWKLITFGKSNLDLLLSKFKQKSNIKTVEVKRVKKKNLSYALVSPINLLTDRQKDILQEAYRLGYYNWPRKIDLYQLSKKFNISKVALLKNIRIAEKKIIDVLLE